MKKLPKRRTANPVLRWFVDESSYAKESTSEFYKIRRKIRPGDVLLVEVRSLISRLIRLFTHSRWTHCALYIGHAPEISRYQHTPIPAETDPRSNSAWLIEANPGEGVVASPLEKYSRHNLRICRPRQLSTRARQKVIENAINYLDGQYDLLLILHLAVFILVGSFLPFAGGGYSHPFRSDSTRMICTGLIWRAFDPVRFVVFPFGGHLKPDQHPLQKGTALLTPSIFLQSPNFRVIEPLGFLSGGRHLMA